MIYKSNFYVYYADTDAGGVVYHSKYIDFCEKCRTDFLRDSNLSQIKLRDENDLLFVVSSMNVKFKSPAKLEDFLTITIDNILYCGCKLVFSQSIFNQRNELLFTAEITVVAINNQYKLYRKIPEFILNSLNISAQN